MKVAVPGLVTSSKGKAFIPFPEFISTTTTSSLVFCCRSLERDPQHQSPWVRAVMLQNHALILALSEPKEKPNVEQFSLAAKGASTSGKSGMCLVTATLRLIF